MTAETVPTVEPYGVFAPGPFDRAVIAMTSRLPVNWLGHRLAIGMRRMVTMRMPEDGGSMSSAGGCVCDCIRGTTVSKRTCCSRRRCFDAGERAALAERIAQVRAANETFVFVDIGANVGLFSFFVASCAHGHARILAIEPERENLRRLRFNIGANKGLPIQVLPHALGASAGKVEIEPHASDRGGTRTRKIDGLAGGGMRVECKPLAQVLEQENVTRIDALKIDVEGVEDRRSCCRSFTAAPKRLWPRFIIIEDSRQTWRVDLFAELRACGYRTVGAHQDKRHAGTLTAIPRRDQLILILASLITFCHLTFSSAMNFSKSAGPAPPVTKLRASSAFFTSGCASISAVSAWIFAMMSFGVPAGANRPNAPCEL